MRTEEKSSSTSPETRSQSYCDHHRERVVSVVERGELPLSLTEITDAVAEESPERDADRVETRLHHVHLPKLDQRGVLEYDASRNVVSGFYGSENE